MCEEVFESGEVVDGGYNAESYPSHAESDHGGPVQVGSLTGPDSDEALHAEAQRVTEVEELKAQLEEAEQAAQAEQQRLAQEIGQLKDQLAAAPGAGAPAAQPTGGEAAAAPQGEQAATNPEDAQAAKEEQVKDAELLNKAADIRHQSAMNTIDKI